jgi:hypothetical protein
MQQAVDDAGLAFDELDAVAVTTSPGLIGALLIGLTAAKAASWALEIPLIAINHLEAHVYGAWFARQTENVSGLRRWESYVFSAAKIIFMPSPMTDAAADLRYKIAPSIASKKLWGDVWSSGTNGATTAQVGQFATLNYPYLCAWKSTSTDVAYLFDTDKAALNATTAFLGVWTNDVLTPSSDYTAATTGITFHAAPGLDTDAAGKIVTCVYEGPLLVRQ